MNTPIRSHAPTSAVPATPPDTLAPRVTILPRTADPSGRTDPDDHGSVGVDVGTLPPTLSVEQAAVILGCGRSLAYNLARRGEFPCRVLRLGRRYVIPTADLLRAIGIPVRPAA